MILAGRARPASRALRPVLTWLTLLALGWVACWLGPGLVAGDPAVLLRPHPPEALRVPYLVLLYGWFLGATLCCWPRHARAAGLPRRGAGAAFLAGLGLGLVAAGVQRLVLALGGWWTAPDPDPGVLLAAVLTAPLLAFAEEVAFRGFLFGTLKRGLGRPGAFLAANLFFASVHLFRPGALEFKAAYGVGLFLVGLVLCRLAESAGTLWPAIGLHSGWIVLRVADPPGGLSGGWLPGLEGDPLAGLVGWLMLLGLLPLLAPLGRRMAGAREDQRGAD
ncbi:MAG: CPBP family intramembrane metalloprotease [Armatimonadetes bacterium]|nr:CPBP family intramembrane metalloprotease [Armatimonadota bacterium]